MEQITVILNALSLVLYAAVIVFLVLARFPGLGEFNRRAGVAAAFLGFAVQAVLLAQRWSASGYFPITGLFSTLQVFALCVMGVTLYFQLRYRADGLLPASAGLAALALFFAHLAPKGVRPLVASLDTPLFFIHVAASFAAYGLFAVAGLLAVFNVLRLQPSFVPGRGARMMDESLFIGYILFTWCMIAGSLWAYLAWGSYWTWNIKALWSTLLWFYYSGVLHLRGRMGWQGWQVNALALVGMILTLFTWLGLGLVFKSNHPLL